MFDLLGHALSPHLFPAHSCERAKAMRILLQLPSQPVESRSVKLGPCCPWQKSNISVLVRSTLIIIDPQISSNIHRQQMVTREISRAVSSEARSSTVRRSWSNLSVPMSQQLVVFKAWKLKHVASFLSFFRSLMFFYFIWMLCKQIFVILITCTATTQRFEHSRMCRSMCKQIWESWLLSPAFQKRHRLYKGSVTAWYKH